MSKETERVWSVARTHQGSGLQNVLWSLSCPTVKFGHCVLNRNGSSVPSTASNTFWTPLDKIVRKQHCLWEGSDSQHVNPSKVKMLALAQAIEWLSNT